MRTFHVRCELDETGWWVATIAEFVGCHTQGRTREQAEERLREALALFVPADVAKEAHLLAEA